MLKVFKLKIISRHTDTGLKKPQKKEKSNVLVLVLSATHPHFQHFFPAPSSKPCQNCVWRHTLKPCHSVNLCICEHTHLFWHLPPNSAVTWPTPPPLTLRPYGVPQILGRRFCSLAWSKVYYVVVCHVTQGYFGLRCVLLRGCVMLYHHASVHCLVALSLRNCACRRWAASTSHPGWSSSMGHGTCHPKRGRSGSGMTSSSTPRPSRTRSCQKPRRRATIWWVNCAVCLCIALSLFDWHVVKITHWWAVQHVWL